RALVLSLHSLLSRPEFVARLGPDFFARLGPEVVAGVAPEGINVRSCARRGATLPRDMAGVLDAVVIVRSGAITGSGSLISPDGYLLTVAHVVGTADSVTVRTSSGIALPGKVIRVDEPQDIALLHLVGSNFHCLNLAEDLPALGADIFAVGSPAGLDFSVSRGIVSGVRDLDGWSFLQTDAAINPGNSGGPLLDTQGRLVGVVSWKLAAPGFEGLGFGIPATVIRARLGLAYGDLSEPDPTTGVGRLPLASPADSLFVDTPDPRRFESITPAERRRQNKRKHRHQGVALMVIGGATVGGTTAWAMTRDHAGHVPLVAATVANTAGWAALAGGGVLVGLSLPCKRQAKP
ncbi:MAG: trypsin-like peptidase domain-containing protein, partial [Armatimonadetes bacterium]|nr:trypsin-like peptidase domain-containing protein [Armatimonadota bacterium]